MKLYLVRHGESTANATRTHAGWAQIPLTEQGEQDAERAGEFLRTISFDRVYSSDLLRAIQTAQIALPNCNPIQLPLIRERSVGWLTGRAVADCEAELGEEYIRNRANLDFTFYGGENKPMLRARAEGFLRYLEANPAESIAAFAHEGFILCAVEAALSIELPLRRVVCANGSVTILSFESGVWRLHALAR